MDQLDVFYRAFKDYRTQTFKDAEYSDLRAAVSNAAEREDKIQIEYNVCTVENDWLDAIDEGLVFVEKAIKEERQFIRSNGEVVPIEKAKNVSVESVLHLARHSNLISKETQTSDDIIPEKLFTVERLSDYAVYENRFLYMLLRYLDDFISLRYNKILQVANVYHGEMNAKKTVDYRFRKLFYEVKLVDENKDDPYWFENNGLKPVLERMNSLLKLVYQLLATPLMQETAKAPMIKPPITKTNVLRMNENFKGAVNLYEFVSAYDSDGFTVKKEIKSLSPFNREVADRFSEVILMNAFLTYQHGMGLEDHLKTRYEEEEARRRAEEDRKQIEQLEKLKKRAEDKAGGIEEYLLLLEKRNRRLEEDSRQLEILKGDYKNLQESFKGIEAAVSERNEKIAEKERQILKERADHEAEQLKLIDDFQKEKAELNFRHNCETEELKSAFEEEKKSILIGEEAKIAELSLRHSEELAGVSDRLSKVEEELSSEREKLSNTEEELLLSEKERITATARLNGLRKQYGLIGSDEEFTSEEDFDELEKQYEYFKILFKEQWKKAKAQIRKDVFKRKKADGEGDKN